MIVIQMGFISYSSARSRSLLAVLEVVPSLATLSFIAPIAGLADRIVIVRVSSNPDDKADCQRDQYDYNN